MFLRGLSRPAQVSVVCAVAGLAVVAIGGFLPWVRSGAATRSSFEAAGVLDRLGPDDVPLLDVVLAGWIAIPLVCVITVGLFVTGLTRTAAAFGLIVALLAGTAGLVLTVSGPGGSSAVSVATTGPLTTCLGGVLALGGCLGALFGRRVRPAPRAAA